MVRKEKKGVVRKGSGWGKGTEGRVNGSERKRVRTEEEESEKETWIENGRGRNGRVEKEERGL